MPLASNDTICTPFIGRTIKGWTVKVRICITVTAATYADPTFPAALFGSNATFATLINALSEATFVPLGTVKVEEIPYGASGQTDNAEDAAVFYFSTAEGTIAKIGIPAPKDAIFLADNMTVNPADTDVAAFIAEMLAPAGYTAGTAVASTKSGAGYVTYLGGLRVRRKTRRKLNIWVKDPTLTLPGI